MDSPHPNERGWRPLHDRFAAIVDDATLHEGVPGWLHPDLKRWLRDLLEEPSYTILADVQQRFRLENLGIMRSDALLRRCENDDELMLDVVNLALANLDTDHEEGWSPDETVVDELETHLARSGSAWRATVRDGLARLERRVPDEVAASAEQAMAPEDAAGGHLRAAWGALYGRHPDERKAVDEAVMAMENVLCALVLPDDGDATLGRAVGQMRKHPDRLQYVLDAPRRNGDPDDAVVALADVVGSVWTTQQRHSTGDGPAGYEPGQAEAAVHVAMTVVHVVREGLLAAP